MEHRALGRSGTEVSRIILGCGNFGGIGSAPAFFGRGESEEEAGAIMDAAWEHGITTFDTADAYGGGRSETMIGNWLRGRGRGHETRDRLVLSTKVFNPMTAGGDSGLSRDRILRQLDSSLERLGVEHVALYLIHEPDPGTPLEETLGALDELVGAGKVAAVGASNIEDWRLRQALATSAERGQARFEWVQNSYSLLDREAEEGVLGVCADEGLGFTPFSPLSGGWLTGKYRRGEPVAAGSRMATRPESYRHLLNEHTYGAIEALERAAADRGVDAATLAIAWLLAQPRVTAVVVGPRRPEHLEPAVAALELELSDDERDELAEFFA